jgi:GTP-binding protein
VTLIGRGELHLAILIETMRREGYEFSLSRPEVVLKEIDGKFYEPWEQVFIEAPESYTGYITASMSKRRANLINMTKIKDYVRFEYEIATSNLIGYRDQLLTNTSGEGVLNNSFLEFRLQSEAIEWNRGGAIVAHQPGQTTIYALDKAQQRGRIIVDPGEQVYAGQVVGFNKRSDDMTMNVCKGKQLTNMRSATADATVVLAPAWKPSLEQFLTLIAKDEMLEVTPKSLRLRKKNLNVF